MRLREEMLWCNAAGVAHSVFMAWDAQDRAKALALQREESIRCVRCGTQPWEWDERRGGSRFAYEAKVKVCPGCERKDWAMEDVPATTPGVYCDLERNLDVVIAPQEMSQWR